MLKYSRLVVQMSCPICGDFSHMHGELYFGDATIRRTYTLGDRCHWLPNRLIEDGGRPQKGDLESEAFLRCENCGHYLLAQLLDAKYQPPPLEFVDSYPHGLKYRLQQPGR